MNHLKLTFALASVTYAISLVRAWNFGVVTRNEIKFFSNRTAIIKAAVPLKHMEAVAYDPIKKDIYVGDSNQTVGSIFRIKTTGKTAYNVTEPIVAKQIEKVNAIAFDHIDSTLYWTTHERIFYVHVPDDEITVPLNGKVLLRIDGAVRRFIAIDVCRKFLYWTNQIPSNATIERSRVSGFGRQVVVKGDLKNLQGIAVDVTSNTLYWNERYESFYHSLHSVDLRDGGTRRTLVRAAENSNPFVIALDDRNVYWLDFKHNKLWMMPKKSSRRNVSPTLVSEIKANDIPLGLFVLSGVDDEIDVKVTSARSKDEPILLKNFTVRVILPRKYNNTAHFTNLVSTIQQLPVNTSGNQKQASKRAGRGKEKGSVTSAGSKDMPLDFKIFTTLVLPIIITINYYIY